jgi:hypothetical protein
MKVFLKTLIESLNKGYVVLKSILINFGVIIDKVNSVCKKYEKLFQTVGIIIGLYLLYLTYISVKISNEQLKITQKQDYQKQLPIWSFDINDSASTVKLKPFTQDVKLEEATAYFPEDLFFKKDSKWNIDQPDFTLHLTVFKEYVKQMTLLNSVYQDSTYSISDRNNFPIGIELNYVQNGELRRIYGIFVIQYMRIRMSEYEMKIEIQGIKFIRYILSNEIFSDELNKFAKLGFKDIKLPK